MVASRPSWFFVVPGSKSSSRLTVDKPPFHSLTRILANKRRKLLRTPVIDNCSGAIESCRLGIDTSDTWKTDSRCPSSPLPRLQLVVSRTHWIGICFSGYVLCSALHRGWGQTSLENQVSGLSRLRPNLAWDRRTGASLCTLRRA